MRIWIVWSVVMVASCYGITLSAQDSLRVSGVVVDRDTEQPLPGATFVSEGIVWGFQTDLAGRYDLMVPSDAQFRVDYIGYEQLSISAVKLAQLDVLRVAKRAITLSGPTVSSARLDYSDQQATATYQIAARGLLVADNVNIAQAFDGLPGVQVQQGALNTQRLSIRGIGARTPFSTDQVRLYWNDIPLTNGTGESVLEDIESGFLDRAIVTNGPGAVQLGANLGGSIQLVSKEWRLPNWYTSAGASYGGFNQNRQWLNLHNHQNRWQQDITLARSASDGYRDNNDYDRLSGTLLGRIGGKKKRAETFYFGHWRSLQAEIPSSLNRDDFEENPESAAANWAAVNGREDQQTLLLGVQHSSQLAKLGNRGTLRNRTSVFLGRQTNDEVRPFNIIAEESRQWGGRTVFLADLARSRFQLGGEFYFENYTQTTFETLEGGAQGLSLATGDEDRQQYFVFADWQYRPDHWDLNASVNIRSTQYQLNGTSPMLPRVVFSPLVLPNLLVKYTPDYVWYFHAQLNRGVSTPDASAAINNLPFNVDPLQPASGWNRELGIVYRTLKNLRIKVTAFQMDVVDAIVARQDAATQQLFFVNGGAARHQGIEAQLTKYVRVNENSQLTINSNYTFADYRFRTFVDGEQDFTDNRIPGNPQHRWLTRVSWQYQAFALRLSVDVAGDQWLDDANTSAADGYELLHLHANHVFGKRSYPIRVFAGVRNVFDLNYASMVQVNARGFGGNLPRYFYPGQPRYWYVGVNLGMPQ